MTTMVNVASTVEAIRSMADQLRAKAGALDALADQMATTGNLELAGNAANIVASPVGHLDWLVTRPRRALQSKE